MFTFQAAEIERRIEQETKAEKHIQKLLLLGTEIQTMAIIYLFYTSIKSVPA